jgi:hypothetical protein
MIALGAGEHFFNYRHEVRAQLLKQLDLLKQAQEPEAITSPAAYVTA